MVFFERTPSPLLFKSQLSIQRSRSVQAPPRPSAARVLELSSVLGSGSHGQQELMTTSRGLWPNWTWLKGQWICQICCQWTDFHGLQEQVCNLSDPHRYNAMAGVDQMDCSFHRVLLSQPSGSFQWNLIPHKMDSLGWRLQMEKTLRRKVPKSCCATL